MSFKHEQTTAILRHKNFIRAYRILDIDDSNLIVRNVYERDKTIAFPVSNSNDYKVGEYVDMTLSRMGDCAYRTKIIGCTPPEFVPNNGIDVF